MPWQPPELHPELGEDRHHVVGEVDRQGRIHLLGRDRDAKSLPFKVRHDLRGPIGEREDAAVGLDADDLGVRHRVLDGSREVDLAAIGAGAGDDQLRRIIDAGELERGWIGGDGGDGRRGGQCGHAKGEGETREKITGHGRNPSVGCDAAEARVSS